MPMPMPRSYDLMNDDGLQICRIQNNSLFNSQSHFRAGAVQVQDEMKVFSKFPNQDSVEQ